MIKRKLMLVAAASGLMAESAMAQPAAQPTTQAAAPVTQGPANVALHNSPAPYPVPYGVMSEANVKAGLDRILNYLSSTTPAQLIDRTTRVPVAVEQATANSMLSAGDFRVISYEWGVTYSGMLQAGEVTGDARYTQYVKDRMNFIGKTAAHYRTLIAATPTANTPVRQLLAPRSLDDIGSMSAAMMKAQRAGGLEVDLRPVINTAADYISTKEFRLPDGTLARNRPLPDTLWLDDLYMSIPALAQMGALTGETRYFTDAAKQVRQFSQRMFNPQKGLYMHGWVQSMDPHPEYRWGRANGWAVLAMVELLDVMPANHPDRPAVLKQLQAHIAGIASYQSGSGFWHQLMDRMDSYEETSATAIFTYAIARSVNKGWIDYKAYGPVAILGWNAVSTKITEKGQIEDVVVGTGMGFDPAFYYHRPVNVLAAHGYGPVLLAGSEIIAMNRKTRFLINDSAVMYVPPGTNPQVPAPAARAPVGVTPRPAGIPATPAPVAR